MTKQLLKRFFEKIAQKVAQGYEILVGVHGREFHEDDALCVSLIKAKFLGAIVRIIRTRDMNELAKCDFILDVGDKDECDGEHLWLDHHQAEEFWANRVRKSACGKLAEVFWGSDPEFLAGLRTELLDSVEAIDNGQNLGDLGLSSSRLFFVHGFNPVAMAGEACSDVAYDDAFASVLPMVDAVLRRVIVAVRAAIASRVAIEQAIAEYDGNGLLVIPAPVDMAWEPAVASLNATLEDSEKVLFVAFKDSDGVAGDLLVVKRDYPQFGALVDLPASWRGLRDDALSEESGVEGAIFCHQGGFMAVWQKFDAAVEAGHRAVALVR